MVICLDSFNASVENILPRLESVSLYTDRYAPLARLMLMHAIRQGNTAKYPMISTIRTAGDLIILGRGTTKDSPCTQDSVWKTICLSLIDGSHWVRMNEFSSKVYDGPTETKISYIIAIRAAAYEGNVSLLETLLDQQPDACPVSSTDLDHPILVATRRGNQDAAEVLAKRPPRMGFPRVGDRYGKTALHLAAESGCLRLFNFCFYRLRISRVVEDARCITPLDIAVSLERMSIIQFVCEQQNEAYLDYASIASYGIYYDEEFLDEINVMEIAAALTGQTAVLECIFTHAKDAVQDMSHEDAVRVAVQNSQMDVIRMIMRDFIMPDSFYLGRAAWEGLEQSIECENMEALDFFVTIPIQRDLYGFKDGEDVVTLQMFFGKGNDAVIKHLANHPELEGSALLHKGLRILVNRGRKDLVEVLLAKPAVDINRRDRYGKTVLTIAKQSSLSMAEFLISKGAHE